MTSATDSEQAIRQDERDRCCKLVCHYCATQGPPVMHDGQLKAIWLHGAIYCEAAAIYEDEFRNLGNG